MAAIIITTMKDTEADMAMTTMDDVAIVSFVLSENTIDRVSFSCTLRQTEKKSGFL